MSIKPAQARAPSPLAQLAGQVPPAPPWFRQAIARKPERSTFPLNGAEIELLTWGEPGRPGLLFLHGDSAHADWWSFIAPFFADRWRCAAFSFSGMGRSGWRDGYPIGQYAQEAKAAIAAAGLDRDGDPPLAVAHSFGGYPAMIAAQDASVFRGLILVDSAIWPDHLMVEIEKPVMRPHHRVYSTQAEALERFRFMPDQATDNLYAIDYIARASLREVEGPEGKGWSWCFDPAIWGEHDKRGDLTLLPGQVRTPLAMIRGGDSMLIPPKIARYMAGLYPPNTPQIVIPAAGHHIMVDEPLALVAALAAMMETWSGAAPRP